MNRTHLFLTVNAKFESCTVWLPIEFHGFTSRINFKGYHSLVPGLISIFSETVWVPLTKPIRQSDFTVGVHSTRVVFINIQTQIHYSQ